MAVDHGGAQQGRPRWMIPLIVVSVLIVLLTAGVCVADVFSKFGDSFTSGRGCLPGDLPLPERAHVTSFNTTFSGGQSDCTVTLEASQPLDEVTAFYATGLDSGDWQVTATDAAQGKMQFKRRSHPATIGQAQLLGHGTSTRIELEVIEQ